MTNKTRARDAELQRVANSGKREDVKRVIKKIEEGKRSENLVTMYRVRRNPAIEEYVRWAFQHQKLPVGVLSAFAQEFVRSEEKPDRSFSPFLSKVITERIDKDSDALQAACTLINSRCYSANMFSNCFHTQGGIRTRQLLVERRPETICSTLHQKKGEPFKYALSILKAVSKERPSEVACDNISDVLEDLVHSEQWTSLAHSILSIAETVNPLSRPDGAVRIDTPYMINWCLQNDFLKSRRMSIRKLISELCSAAGCAEIPDLKCIHKLMDLNRTVDLLMFLDQGSKRYRGHDIHQFNVAALGLFFLNTEIRRDNLEKKAVRKHEGEKLKSYLASKYKKRFGSADDLEKTWLITSLLHDHAIPIGHMFEIAPMIRRIQKENIDSKYGEALESLKQTLRSMYQDLFSDDLLDVYGDFEIDSDLMMSNLDDLASGEMNKIGVSVELARRDLLDHGVLAAVNITSRFSDKSLDLKVRNSARAIALHNMKNLPIKFSEDPLAFLLVLCDELQEWGREITIFPEIMIDISSVKIKGFHIDRGRRYFTNEMQAIFRSPRKFIDRHSRAPEFKVEFFDAQKQGFFKERLSFDMAKIFPEIRPLKTETMT